MKKVELETVEYYNNAGMGKYAVMGELTGTFHVLGSFKEFTLVSCPFENSCYLILID